MATVRSLGFGFLFIYAMRMAALIIIVITTIGRRLRLLPDWLVVTGYLAGLVLMLNVTYAEVLTLAFPAWVAAVSVVILRRVVASPPGEGAQR